MWFSSLRADIAAAKRNDPAARNKFEIFLTYSGVHALSYHRAAHFFHRIHFKLLARLISQWAKFQTGIEIHPAAKISPGVFIDHGSGVVIGETAEVHTGVVIYQGVTLGGNGKERGKRHPTVMENATVFAGAKILGGFTVGEGAKIGAGAVVLKEVPPPATVVGVPGRIVRIDGERVSEPDLCQEKADPYQLYKEELCNLRARVAELEKLCENKKPTGQGCDERVYEAEERASGDEDPDRADTPASPEASAVAEAPTGQTERGGESRPGGRKKERRRKREEKRRGEKDAPQK